MHKDLLYFYTLAVNNLKVKIRKAQYQKRIKFLGINLIKEVQDFLDTGGSHVSQLFPSCSGGRDQEDHSSKPAWANNSQDPIPKIPNTKQHERSCHSGSSGRMPA
jgi:hypothetical protein